MTYAENGFMPLNRQLFRRSLAEALQDLLSQKYPTAKAMARGVKIDPSTAENLRKQHLSITTLEKALLAEGRELWNRLGDEIYGETFYQFEERRIEVAMKEAEGARSNLVRLRAEAEGLLARAPRMDEVGPGPAPVEARDGEGRSWAEVDGRGDSRPARTRDRGQR